MKATASSHNITIKVYDDFATSGATEHEAYTVDMTGSNVTHNTLRVVLRDATGKQFLVAKNPRIELTDVADDEAWGIEKIILEYQVLPGKRRT